MQLLIPQQSRPSYKSGYARSAAESENPDLWSGLKTAWVPALGNTGSKVFDLGPNRRNLSISLANNTWAAGYLDSTAAEDAATFTALPSMTEWTVVSYCEQLDSTAIGYGLFAMDNDTRNVIGWRPSVGYQQIVQNSYATVLYDWGSASDINRGKSDSWSWRFRDSTACRLGRNAEFHDSSSAPTSTFNWPLVDRLFERGTAYGSHVKWQTILVYDRWLSDRELVDLNNDPLAPFRRKQFVPYAKQIAAATFNPAWGSPITKMANYWN